MQTLLQELTGCVVQLFSGELSANLKAKPKYSQISILQVLIRDTIRVRVEISLKVHSFRYTPSTSSSHVLF